MKSKRTLILAASFLALTISALPHVAVAGTTTAPQTSSDMRRKAGGTPLEYLQVILAAGNLISLLVP